MSGRVIVWRITQSCNMKCRFCSYSTQVERLRSDADEREIERLCAVLGEYKRETGEEMLVSWIGGEPFLQKNLIAFSKTLHNSGIDVAATTNGLLLGDGNLRRGICENFSEIVFSLDSFRDCNDDVRQCPGHFDTVSENIRGLDKLRRETGSSLKIKVNTILMRRNASSFEEFCEYLRGIGVDEVTFNQLGGFDRPEFYGDNRLSEEQARELCERLPEMQKRFSEKGFIVRGSSKYLERILKTARGERISIGECMPAEWFWFINENGFISPCSYTSYEYKFDTKEIRSVGDFARAEEFFRLCRKNSRSKWCDDCYCTQVYDKFE